MVWKVAKIHPQASIPRRHIRSFADLQGPHCQHKGKVGARNNILKKLANTKWGTDAKTIRTTALALCFSAAEYASPVWSRSAHAAKIDPVLNTACRAITGCLKPTRVDDLYLLCGIAPPHIRRTVVS